MNWLDDRPLHTRADLSPEEREQARINFEDWRKDEDMKTKKTPYGPARRPPNTDKAQANLDALGGLINDIADAVRKAQAREQVVDSANPVDTTRFPVARPNGVNR